MVVVVIMYVSCWTRNSVCLCLCTYIDIPMCTPPTAVHTYCVHYIQLYIHIHTRSTVTQKHIQNILNAPTSLQQVIQQTSPCNTHPCHTGLSCMPVCVECVRVLNMCVLNMRVLSMCVQKHASKYRQRNHQLQSITSTYSHNILASLHQVWYL